MPTLTAVQLEKRFGQRAVIRGLDCLAASNKPLAITGPNGSGKTTTLQILAGLIRPTSGVVSYEIEGTAVAQQQARNSISFVAPYGNLYDQLTAEEHLRFFAEISGRHQTGKEIDQALLLVGQKERAHDRVGEFSTGMKQRLKFAVGLSAKPSFMFIDEPTAHLDTEGKKLILELLMQCARGIAVVIATNEQEDLREFKAVCRLS